MHMRMLFAALVVGMGSVSLAQQPPPQLLTPAPLDAQRTDAQDPVPPTSYVVTLSEYRIAEGVSSERSASEIVDWIASRSDEQDFTPLATIRLTIISDAESMVQFGRRVVVTTGTVTNSRAGTMRQSGTLEIGTMIRVKANPVGDKIALRITFESSRLDGEHDGDSPPDVSHTNLDTTLLLEADKPTLLGGITDEAASLFFVTISP